MERGPTGAENILKRNVSTGITCSDSHSNSLRGQIFTLPQGSEAPWPRHLDSKRGSNKIGVNVPTRAAPASARALAIMRPMPGEGVGFCEIVGGVGGVRYLCRHL
jgi:hypothetical protein